MTLNQARAILKFIIALKKQKMSNDDIVFELANNFNIDSVSGTTLKSTR